MQTSNPHIEEILKAMTQRRLVPVVGAGVSTWTASLPGWIALVERGLDYVAGLGTHSPQEIDDARQLLASSETIEAAQRLKSFLRAPSGEYRRWLRRVFRVAPDQVISDRLIGAIRRLYCPIVATTNYDKLISLLHYPMMDPVAWRNPALMHDALTEGGAVLHLHGVYDDPESVVLGEDDYEALVHRAPAYRDVLRTLWLDRTLLFIGCSFAGIEDPDFLNLLTWSAETFPDTAHKHYALIRNGRFKPEDVGRFLHNWRIQIIGYGDTFDDLAPFIEALSPGRDMTQLPPEGGILNSHGQPFEPVVSGAEVLQLVRQSEELQVRASSAQERYLQNELERLRTLLNGGYAKPAQDGLKALIGEIEGSDHAPIAAELKGRIYLLAANAFVPVLLGGDAGLAHSYLSRARTYLSSDRGIAGCSVAEARLLSAASDKKAALTLLSELHHPDADRVAFSIHLDAEVLSACATILEELSSSGVLDSDDWYRLLALYYSKLGDAHRLSAVVEKLTSTGEAADFSTAAYALFHQAYRDYRAICQEHHICPDINFAGDLGLDQFIDASLELRAIRLFERAADAYERHECPADAAREVANALRLSMDSQTVESLAPLVQRLERLEPDYSLLAAIKGEMTGDAGSRMARLRELVASAQADPNVILDLANAVRASTEHVEGLLELLAANPEHFSKSDDAHVRYLHVLYNLYTSLRPPAETESWLSSMEPPALYRHVKPIFHIMFYSERDPGKAAEWVESALREYPDRPEILKVGFYHYSRVAWDPEKALTCALSLFEVLRTGTTAGLLLELLLEAQRFPRIIQFVQDNSDLQIDEQVLHRALGRAYTAESHFVQARQHLEWLRTSGYATLTDLLNLATNFVYTGDLDSALHVLNGTLARFPDEPKVFLALSDVYLQRGDNAESFRVALDAYRHFPEDTQVALHFVRTGFTTGYDTDGAVTAAFKEFMPDGRFGDSGHFEMVPLQEGIDMILARQKWVQSVYSLYKEGRSSLMMVCHLQDGPLFRAHVEGVQFRLPRYAGIGAHLYDIAKLIQPPKEVVLDYSALLTLWSLYGDRWMEVLRENYEKVWISAKLPGILTWENDLLRNRGQADHHQANIIIRDAANRFYAKLQRLPGSRPEGERDVLGQVTETAVARERNLPYLQEHLTEDDHFPDVQIVGVRAVADALIREGKISPQLKGQLVAHARAMLPDEQASADRLAPGTDIVAGITTLTTIALNGGLQALHAFLDYFGTIYYAEPAWQQLQGEIDEYERLLSMAEDLRRLRGQVGSAISSGLLNANTAPDSMWAFPLLEPDEDEDDKSKVTDVLNSNIGYLNDMFAAARVHGAPVWADDRWIIKAVNGLPEDARPPDIFGTDSFLILKRTRTGNDTEYFDNYGKLVHWRYLGLPLNADYLFWLLEQGYAADRGLVADAATLYVQNALHYMAPDSALGTVTAQFKQELLDTYGQSLIVLLHKCYHADLSADRVAALFKILDPTRHYVPWENTEYHYYGCLLVEALIGRGLELTIDAYSTTVSDSAHDVIATEGLRFKAWLEMVLLASGVSEKVLADAKLDILG